MNWRMLDLNLLVVLDAVAQEQSATRAARLNTSQSSISHALGRLRLALGDQFFVRTPNGMEPTPYCARIAGPIRAALQSLNATLDGAAAFDPAESTRAFVVAVDNRAALVLGPTLAAAVAAQAANVALQTSLCT